MRAEILEPESLKTKMQDQVKKLAENYRKISHRLHRSPKIWINLLHLQNLRENIFEIYLNSSVQIRASGNSGTGIIKNKNEKFS